MNIQFRFRRDVAEENRVSVSLVSRIASKCKGGVAWLEEQRAKEATCVSQVDAVREAVVSLIRSSGRIASVAEVHKQAS